MVDGRGGDNGFGLADIPVNLLKALHEAGNGARTDGDMLADLYVAPTQFAGRQSDLSAAGRVLDPQEILGEQLAKAPVNLTDPRGFDGKPALERPAINPPLHCDVRLGFQLQVALTGILTVVVLDRPLDVDRMGIVSLNQV